MNSLQQSTAQKLLIIINLVIPIKLSVSKFTIQVPETNLDISEVNNYHLKEPADDFTGKHPKRQACARSEPYQRQETDQRKKDRGV